MSELSEVIEDSDKRNKEVARTTEEKKTGRKWVRYVIWSVAIVAAGLLISGTLAALLWCN